MTLPSQQRLAQIATGVLLLAVIRSLGEFFRLQYLQGDALTAGQVAPYVGGALFATIALAVTIFCYFARLYRISIAATVAAVILLIIYKIAVMR